MSEQMTEMIAARLDALAAKLGTTVEYLWSVLVKQAPIDAATDVICALFCLLFVGLYFYCLRRFAIPEMRRPKEHGWDDASGAWAGAVLGGIAATIATAIALAFISDAFTAALNPEYWALQHVLRAVK